MKSLITDEMIKEFNEVMTNENSIVRLQRNGSAVEIVLIEDKYLDSENKVYPNDKFYKKLEDFFNSKGICNLSYNISSTMFC